VTPGFVAQQQRHGTAWTTALLGFIPGARVSARHPPGCLPTARAELFGPAGGNPDPDPVPGMAFQASNWTQSDRRIVALQARWSACMRRLGFSYRAPSQPAYRSWPSPPSPLELATAETDVRCKTQTNFVNTWLAVEAAYQQALIGQNSVALAQLRAGFGTLLRRAELLLQRPAGPLMPGPGRPPGGVVAPIPARVSPARR
jgi:hypothetical protein